MAPSKDEAHIKAFAAVQSIFDRYKLIASTNPRHHFFDQHVMENVKLIDASPDGSVLFELLIGEAYRNINGVMHGGAAAVIFDMCTTTALGPLSKPGYWFFLGGVTRILNISYLRAIPIGTTIHIRSWVTQIGQTMAMIRSEMTSTDGKTIFATCEHHKVNVPTRPEHIAIRLPWDDDQEIELQEEAERKAKKAVKL